MWDDSALIGGVYRIKIIDSQQTVNKIQLLLQNYEYNYHNI